MRNGRYLKLVDNHLSQVLTLRFSSFFKTWQLEGIMLLEFVILEDWNLEIIVELADTLQDVLRTFKSDHGQADQEGNQNEIPINKHLYRLRMHIKFQLTAPLLIIQVVFLPFFCKILWPISNPSKSYWNNETKYQNSLNT